MSFIDDEDELCPPANEEEELTLPRASINKIIKEVLPNVRVVRKKFNFMIKCL